MSISIIIKILIINQYFQVYERAFVIYIAFDQYYMPPTNEAIGQRTKVQKLDKTSTVIKKKQPPQQRRRLLEQSFAKMNAELARKSSSLSSSSSSLLGLVVEATDKKQKPDNIFMDILKIAPVIDLASEEHRATLPAGNDSIDIEAVEQEEEILAQQPTSSTASTTIVQKEAKILGKKKKLLQKGGGGCLFEVKTKKVKRSVIKEVKCEPLTNTSNSDIDLRAKPNDVMKLRNRNILKEPLPTVNASPGSKSDLDLREEIGGALKKTKKSVPINQLEPSTSKSRHTQMQPRPTTQNDSVLVSSSFISRVRMCILAPPIDLTKHYQLHGLRYFQEISGNQLDQCDYQPVPLRVVSFNVLCQKSLMDVSYLYSYLRGPRGRLTNWAERQPKLELEFQRLDADIFCLQEVQDCHYEQFYLPYFTNRGYLGEFTRRTGEQTPDGCALFWRPQRLLLIHLLPIEYNLHVDTMNRDNVGQIAVFGVPGHRSAICISNTHIYFNMKRGEVKLAQLAYLLSSMHRVEQQFRNKQISSPLANIFTHFVGHILCGDFNMEPGSALHRFMVNQRIDLHLERTGLAFCSTNTYNNNNSLHQQQQLMSNYLGSNSASIGRTARPIQLPVRAMAISGNCTFVEKSSNALMNMNCGELTHGFKLASVYEHRNALGEKELSTYHRDEGQPDYIFYSVFDQREMTPEQDERPNADNNAVKPTAEGSEVAHESYIQLRKRLSLPTRAQMNNACGPIPNEQYGSDHLSLCAVFDILCLPQK